MSVDREAKQLALADEHARAVYRLARMEAQMRRRRNNHERAHNIIYSM